MDQLTPIMS